MPLLTIILLLFTSFIGDQVFQKNEVMQAKHKDWAMLFIHVVYWGVVMLIFTLWQCYQLHHIHLLKWWMLSLVSHYGFDGFINWIADPFRYKQDKKRMFVLITHIDMLVLNLYLIFTYPGFI